MKEGDERRKKEPKKGKAHKYLHPKLFYLILVNYFTASTLPRCLWLMFSSHVSSFPVLFFFFLKMFLSSPFSSIIIICSFVKKRPFLFQAWWEIKNRWYKKRWIAVAAMLWWQIIMPTAPNQNSLWRMPRKGDNKDTISGELCCGESDRREG